jgi:hypothetical protein
VKTILLFGVSAGMVGVIRGALMPRGFELVQISSPLEVASALALSPEIELVIAACDHGGRLEPLTLVLEDRLEVPVLLLLREPVSRDMRSLLPHAAATLQWPCFPSDLVETVTWLQASSEHDRRNESPKLAFLR